MRPVDFSTLGAAGANGVEITVLHITMHIANARTNNADKKKWLRTETHAESRKTDRNHHSLHSEEIWPRSKHTKHTEKCRNIQTAHHQGCQGR